jgi:hypothetical protein
MKTQNNKLQKLSLKDGKFEGGFSSLSTKQLERIKGGSQSNSKCANGICW